MSRASILAEIINHLAQKGHTEVLDDLQEQWRTINGTHVLIEPGGKIEKGPPKMEGVNVENIPNQKEPSVSKSSRKPVGYLNKEKIPPTEVMVSCVDEEGEDISRIFEKKIGLSPQKLCDQMFKDLEAEGKFNIERETSRSYVMKFTGVIGDSTVTLQRSFNIEDMSVSHDSFRIESEYTLNSSDVQGKGLGKKIFKNALDLYDSMGVKEIKLFADLEVGGYAWARYGFVPKNNEHWDIIRKAAASTLKKDYLLAKSDKDVLNKILSSDDPASIGILAAYRDKDGKHLGKELLLKLSEHGWVGKLDLNNEDRYSVARAYVGE